MSDIVERLNACLLRMNYTKDYATVSRGVAEILILRAENEKLRAELKDNISFIRKQADEIAELRKAAALREMGHE